MVGPDNLIMSSTYFTEGHTKLLVFKGPIGPYQFSHKKPIPTCDFPGEGQISKIILYEYVVLV